MPETILTGLRSNANLTLGNYLGAIKPMLDRQEKLSDDDKFFLFAPDLHSFVTPIDHTRLYQQTLENIKIYLASGIDPARKNVFLYRQSHVPAHSELAWILSCFSYFGEMSKMTQFKDKSSVKGQNVNVGLFTYPILMACDIILYNADYVPVGEDQRQHLELARDLAIRFNHKFDQEIFVVPKPWKEQLEFTSRDQGIRIRSLQNPESKMSKSVDDPKGTILLIDEPKVAAKKIMGAVTDDLGVINWNWEKQPGITNLLQIFALFTDTNFTDTANLWNGKTSYGELKKTVAELIENFLTDFQTKIATITDEQAEKVLQEGEREANMIAGETLLRAQIAVGVRR
jgi:tryptophanyl-tRNA synthetase